MTPLAATTLLMVMLVLAAIPSASVALVVTRSATHGFSNGIAVALGIVLADLVFVALAILGLGFLAETLGSFFITLRYLGGAYLIWLGIRLLRSPGGMNLSPAGPNRFSLFASFTSGFLLTLGDVKAILFYASLFPAFVDMASLTSAEIIVICLVTIISVGGVKTLYAFAAEKIMKRIGNRKSRRLAQSTAGGLMVGAGTYIIAKS